MEDVFTELRKRGLVAECSQKGDIAAHLRTPRTLYCGFDPTADSLHVGSLMPLITMLRFVRGGHNVIALIGGGTGLVGDPSFKTAERSLQDVSVLEERCVQIRLQCERLYDNFIARYPQTPGETRFSIRNNSSWLGQQKLIDFLRDVGKHFSVNAMVKKESVSARLARDDQGISFTEFSYMLLQAYDFVQLYQRESCTLQIGGSDQWGNIVAGITLIRRTQGATGDELAYGITLPLITRSDGGKFGKTESGTVWLDGNRTSPYAFHQFWLNVHDADLYRYLRYFSFIDVEELARREADARESTQLLLGDKQALAEELTLLVHGTDSLTAVRRIREALFADRSNELSEDEFGQLVRDGMESTELEHSEHPLAECLVACGLARTPNGEITLGQARKLIRAGAIHVNGTRIADEHTVLSRKQAMHGKYYLLKRGKKHFHLLRWT